MLDRRSKWDGNPLNAVCLALAALWLAAPDVPAADDPPPKGTLRGRVVDPDGKPVAGARVGMETIEPKARARKPLFEGRTDVDGRFRIEAIEPFAWNRFDLTVDSADYARGRIPTRNVAVFPGLDNDLGTIRLDRGRVFTGKVVDVDGKPRAGTPVEVVVYRHEMGHTVENVMPAGLTVDTSADGSFRTPPLPVGTLSLLVRAADRRNAHAGRPIAPGGEEDLGEIRLEPDVPFEATVIDDAGNPVVGAKIGGTVGHEAVTDARGRFVLRGFAPNPSFQLNLSKEGHAGTVGRVTVTPKGVTYRQAVPGRVETSPPVEELVVTLARAGWVEGTAVDADSGEPVRLSSVVVCNFERKPGGEVVLRGCRSYNEQVEPGRFRVSYPTPDEYHLTFTAEGYHDAEAFTPKVDALVTVQGIVARMKRKEDGSRPTMAKQAITGTVTRNGRPVASGWAVLWATRRARNAPNALVRRGRTIEAPPVIGHSAPIVDGKYTLQVPYQGTWYVVVEEPGRPLAQSGPIKVALGQDQTVDLPCPEGGFVRGRVEGVPDGWKGHGWVVAFSKSAVHSEARVEVDGTFAFPTLPPGEYGLKVGHDAYEDPETYPGKLAQEHRESFNEVPDPWKRAKVVKLEPGGTIEGVVVEWPR